jgi:CRP-like cAMP-binding protein
MRDLIGALLLVAGVSVVVGVLAALRTCMRTDAFSRLLAKRDRVRFTPSPSEAPPPLARENTRKPTTQNVVKAIRDPMKLQHLRNAAVKQGVEEGIDFVLEAEQYKLLSRQSDRARRAAAMYKKYIMPGADMPINIPEAMAQQIAQKWENAEADLFEEVNEEVLKVICDDVFDEYITEVDKAANTAVLRCIEPLKMLGEPEIVAAVQSLEKETYEAGEVIYRQDDDGEYCFLIRDGECYATSLVHTFVPGTRVEHEEHGMGVVAEDVSDSSTTRIVFQKGASRRFSHGSINELKPLAAVAREIVETARYSPKGQAYFGERALSRSDALRAETVTCATAVTVMRLSKWTFLRLRQQQEHKENLLRGVAFFETFDDDQIADLASLLQRRDAAEGEALLVQGEEGHDLFILDEGECVATIKNGADEQVVKRYLAGAVFGEKALLENAPRAATVSAVGKAKTWFVSREDFEAKLGPISKLKGEQYINDPRTLISQFYGRGDTRGPAGSLAAGDTGSLTSWFTKPSPTSWFAVYRPCSRDSIAKMVGRVGTGKGLNIKGKSAKKNRLSGFVPFCQISKNDDKAKLEATPADARLRIFFQNAAACATVKAAFESVLVELQEEKGEALHIADPEVRDVHEYEPKTYGLDVPEMLMLQVRAYPLRANPAPRAFLRAPAMSVVVCRMRVCRCTSRMQTCRRRLGGRRVASQSPPSST